ncbi:MAG: glycosyltransferase family 4 protein [Bacteroidetes bacterium]|nr:glycosyltransferase family 4 protein [Bacteroidota bacterium]
MNKSSPSVAIIDPVGTKAGLDHYNQSLLMELKAMGCEVALYSNFLSDKIQSSSEPFFKFRKKQTIFSLYKLMQEYRRSIAACKNSGIQFIILHGFHFNFLDAWLVRKISESGFKIILIVHDVESFVFSPNKSRLKRICEKYVHKLVVHNEYTRTELLSLLDVKTHSQIQIIPHGNFLSLATEKLQKAEAREILGLEQEKKIVLFFGLIKPSKGLDVLLRAVPQIDPNTEFVIAGRLRKHSFNVYNEIIRKEYIHGRIHYYLHHISNEQRNLFFSAADVIVLPYKKIYQSGVLLMAMSYGLPAVVSNLPAMKEVVQHNENGLLFQSDDADDLSSQVNRILRDDQLRIRIGQKEMEYCGKHHDWKRIAAAFYSLFS